VNQRATHSNYVGIYPKYQYLQI